MKWLHCPSGVVNWDYIAHDLLIIVPARHNRDVFVAENWDCFSG